MLTIVNEENRTAVPPLKACTPGAKIALARADPQTASGAQRPATFTNTRSAATPIQRASPSFRTMSNTAPNSLHIIGEGLAFELTSHAAKTRSRPIACTEFFVAAVAAYGPLPPLSRPPNHLLQSLAATDCHAFIAGAAAWGCCAYPKGANQGFSRTSTGNGLLSGL